MMADDIALQGQPPHLANGSRGRSQLLPYQPHGFTALLHYWNCLRMKIGIFWPCHRGHVGPEAESKVAKRVRNEFPDPLALGGPKRREASTFICKILSYTIRTDLKNKQKSAETALFLSSVLGVQDRILKIRVLASLGKVQSGVDNKSQSTLFQLL